MNNIVPSCTLRNFKSIVLEAYGFYKCIQYQLFEYQGLSVPSLWLQVLSGNQNSIINLDLSSFFIIKSSLFVVNRFKDVVNVIVHHTHSIQLILYSGSGACVVSIEWDSEWIKPTETLCEKSFLVVVAIVLLANSARGSYTHQWFCLLWQQMWTYCMSACTACLLSPSVCRWQAAERGT